MNKKTICLVGGYRYVNYANWLHNVKLTDNPKRADVLLFAGGEDVDPKLYGQKEGKFTYCNYQRDNYEVAIFKENPDKFKLGICRGLN